LDQHSLHSRKIEERKKAEEAAKKKPSTPAAAAAPAAAAEKKASVPASSSSGGAAASSPSKFGGGSLKCAGCGKTVYAVEKLVMFNKTYHKWCFKCSVCGASLNMNNYSASGGQIYCKPHYPAPGKDIKDAPIPEAGSGYGDASRGSTQVITSEREPVSYNSRNQEEEEY